MNSAELRKYIKGVFDVEMSLYTKNAVLANMRRLHSSLGKAKSFAKPKQKVAENLIPTYMGVVGVGCGLITGIVFAILSYWVYRYNVFFGIINGALGATVGAVLGFIVGGLTIGTVVGIVARIRKQRALDAAYDSEWDAYEKRLKNDKTRVEQENVRKKLLEENIRVMTSSIQETKRNLAQLYSYGILHEDYRNIYALSSIYGYLEKGRTYSLARNEKTGDPGAYSIYEEEMRLGMIITNTEEILRKMDRVIDGQRELSLAMQEAQSNIRRIDSSVQRSLSSIGQSVKTMAKDTQLVAYNTACARSELELMNWMRLL